MYTYFLCWDGGFSTLLCGGCGQASSKSEVNGSVLVAQSGTLQTVIDVKPMNPFSSTSVQSKDAPTLTIRGTLSWFGTPSCAHTTLCAILSIFAKIMLHPHPTPRFRFFFFELFEHFPPRTPGEMGADYVGGGF